MKNLFKKVLGIISLSILAIPQFCYADLIAPYPRPSTSASNIASIDSSVALYCLVLIGVMATVYFCVNAKK